MRPVHEVVSRIRWDKQFGSGRFELGYYDRIERGVLRVSFCDIDVDPESPNLLYVRDPQGKIRSIPVHRIKDVYRNNRRIWHREH